MCLDANGMEWLHALMNKTEPPDKVGFVFGAVRLGCGMRANLTWTDYIKSHVQP
jgi:hypothetical protein